MTVSKTYRIDFTALAELLVRRPELWGIGITPLLWEVTA